MLNIVWLTLQSGTPFFIDIFSIFRMYYFKKLFISYQSVLGNTEYFVIFISPDKVVFDQVKVPTSNVGDLLRFYKVELTDLQCLLCLFALGDVSITGTKAYCFLL
jgi:hypothetical protein